MRSGLWFPGTVTPQRSFLIVENCPLRVANGYVVYFRGGFLEYRNAYATILESYSNCIIYYQNGYIYWYFKDESGSILTLSLPYTPYNAYVAQIKENKMLFWENGILKNSREILNTSSFDNGEKCGIGGWTATTEREMRGILQKVIIYNYSLIDREIQELFKGRIVKEPTAYLDFTTGTYQDLTGKRKVIVRGDLRFVGIGKGGDSA